MRALVDQHHLGLELVRDTLDAQHFAMGLKPEHRLRQRQIGEPAGNLVLPSARGTLERNMRMDSLAIVKRFRQHLQQHFKPDSF